MTSAVVRAPSLREVRAGLAEVLRPVSAVHEELARGWDPAIDRTAAARRVRAGRPAFDAIEALQEVGDLHRPFHRATQAFERAGLASQQQVQQARTQHARSVLTLSASWLAGEPLPRSEPRRLAHRAAAVVARTVLQRAAQSVKPALRATAVACDACPACGGAAEFLLHGPRGRRLTCSRCDTTWASARRGCLGCDAHEPPTVFRIPSPDVGYDLVVCNACGRYLKQRMLRGGSDLVVERALTAQLDAAAERRGLRL